mmetsp:Transcript_25704/g.53687  ORF Transcript_25704/g.53687 Transcript_25704/m.53687 type:complete len:287 (+) Transcript_25704:2690-3550(+)
MLTICNPTTMSRGSRRSFNANNSATLSVMGQMSMESASHSHPLTKLCVSKLSMVRAWTNSMTWRGCPSVFCITISDKDRTRRTGMRSDSESISFSVSTVNPEREMLVRLTELSESNFFKTLARGWSSSTSLQRYDPTNMTLTSSSEARSQSRKDGSKMRSGWAPLTNSVSNARDRGSTHCKSSMKNRMGVRFDDKTCMSCPKRVWIIASLTSMILESSGTFFATSRREGMCLASIARPSGQMMDSRRWRISWASAQMHDSESLGKGDGCVPCVGQLAKDPKYSSKA